jgi:hypothetical protein
MNGRRRIWVLGVAAGSLVVLLAAFGSLRLVSWVLAEEQPKAEETGKAFDKAKDEKPGVKKIPLEEIYATTTHEGMKWAWQRVNGAANAKTQEYVSALISYRKFGGSSIFLVRGSSFGEALKATHRVFYSGAGVDRPASADQLSRSRHLWLVVYFGHAQSGPQEWSIRPPEIEGHDIRVSFEQYDGSDGRTADIYGYVFWIPLGELQPGTYKLTLIDFKDKEIALMRRTVVDIAR